MNRAVVLTISDRCSRGQAEDLSGPAIVEQLARLDASLVHRQVIADERDQIQAAVRSWVGRSDIILLTGGTGVSERDVTPEAVAPLIERALPGFGEVMRLRGFEGNPMSIVSRGGGGLAGRTLIVWLPGSPKAVSECLSWLAPAIRHVCAFVRGKPPH